MNKCHEVLDQQYVSCKHCCKTHPFYEMNQACPARKENMETIKYKDADHEIISTHVIGNPMGVFHYPTNGDIHLVIRPIKKDFDPSNLGHGLYRIFWTNGGGSSLAAVGSKPNGERWMAPTNWVSVGTTDWSEVDRVELIAK